MKGRSCLPNDAKFIVCICFGAFLMCSKMLSYCRITGHYRISVFAHTRSLFFYYITFLADALFFLKRAFSMLNEGTCGQVVRALEC